MADLKLMGTIAWSLKCPGVGKSWELHHLGLGFDLLSYPGPDRVDVCSPANPWFWGWIDRFVVYSSSLASLIVHVIMLLHGVSLLP
ncbi:hypothetical protein CI610_02805 [invertebrate metagenome]|uniref:Uncharacterized protein n=1 Tax=invertebrate metagenome TaxID=1711999 RepID=A0A2H9T4X3_9ZZZZ